MTSSRRFLLGPLLALFFGCSSPHEAPPAHDPSTSTAPGISDRDVALAKVAAIHGGAGPWAVAGYRMGVYALTKLQLPAQSFDLEVVHHSPREIQYSCIADGAAAATGASIGKLNLKLEDADVAHTSTTYTKKSTGESLTLRPTAAFAARFVNVPRPQLGDAGRTVISLRDDEIFEQVK